MGLDMFAYVTAETINSPVDFTVNNPVEIAYWRKHPNLHGWMEELYRDKGGAAPMFNCVNVELTAEDLDRLEADINGNALPFTTGCFFGESTGNESIDDLAFVANARRALAQGLTVFYSAWW